MKLVVKVWFASIAEIAINRKGNVMQWFELVATRRCWPNTKGTDDLLFLALKWHGPTTTIYIDYELSEQ